MIKLDRASHDWKEWQVSIDGTSFSLGDIGSPYSENTFDIRLESNFIPLSSLPTPSLSDIPRELVINLGGANGELGKHVTYIFISTYPGEEYFGYVWEIDPEKWESPLNPFMIRDELAKHLVHSLCDGDPKRVSSANDDYMATIYFNIDYSLPNEDLLSTIETVKNTIDVGLEKAEEKLLLGGYSNKIVAKFQFAPEAQQACTSYVLYFIEFLRDMGIDANGQIESHESNVLFTVEPKSKDESLTVISQALAMYLSSSEVDIHNITPSADELDPLTELKIEKLKSEIDRLKSSLRTNEAILRYQDRLLTNSKHTQLPKQPLEGLSEVYVDDKKLDKGSFLGGGIKLGVYKKAGIEIDWKALISFFSRI
ncbi:hypothetical protein TUMSATVNIG1_41510 [Vibrio nigripulchritudo]|uniref:hypothetical protein n=1 Tax=Vibrio nigripulchritudo TaxID=28173 RepID=UPI00190B769F|nr:hypothetical protein [Vibrio nigripulchritudo]BCL72184.1 hypothetical protein VNTUMSATTG_41210 [Vibrio nigripulchritudo]BDU33542.1 hypothetical protein TUMSATVNIG1_41510 [Vibrio nigripulchritudo]